MKILRVLPIFNERVQERLRPHSDSSYLFPGSKSTFGNLQKWFYNKANRHLVDIGIHAEKEVIQ
jgi:hypothetical protein